MDILLIRALRGPNLWAHCKAIEVHVACEEPECAILEHSKFKKRLCVLLPDGHDFFKNKSANPLSVAHALAFIMATLQERTGYPVAFHQTQAMQQSNVFHVIVEYAEEEIGRLATEIAVNLCHAALKNTAFDLISALKQLQDLSEDIRLGPSTQAIVNHAVARHIPFQRLTDGSLVQFGWGSKQRRIQASVLDNTNIIAEKIAQNKEVTKQILAAHGVPVPKGRAVRSLEDAWVAASEIGLPVVVKPKNGRQGNGVVANVTTREQLITAYHIASASEDEVLVERHIQGRDFRLLIVGDKLIAAARRDPPSVTGDGKHTIRELVAILNQDPRRGVGHGMPMTYIELDNIALTHLEAQGFSLDSIPTENTLLILRQNANLSCGGSATDVTDKVHPTIARCAIEAALAAGGLNPCGVDLVCEHIDKPIHEQEAGVVEINASPGLRMHLLPSYGSPQPVGEAIINDLFPCDNDGRIPIVAVTGTNGKTTTVRLINHLLTQHGMRVGMTTTDGVFVQNHRIEIGDCSGPKSAAKILLHPDVDAAVFETARGGILREGLAFDHCQIAVVTNIGHGDHLGIGSIHTREDLATLKSTIVSSLRTSGVAVLNAADPLVVKMAERAAGSIIFFAPDPKLPVIVEHLKQGLRAIYIEDRYIIVAEGIHRTRILLDDIPITMNGTVNFQVENVMASIGAALGLGVPWPIITLGLKTFVSDINTTPGRFNVFKHRGAKLIADYGHNEDAILSLVQAIESMPANRRSVAITGTGDRRDQDIRRLTQILGDVFDDIFIFPTKYQRGRPQGEIERLLHEGLVGAKRASVIEDIHDEMSAIDMALARVNEGDLCLLLIDQVDKSLKYIMQQIDHR